MNAGWVGKMCGKFCIEMHFKAECTESNFEFTRFSVTKRVFDNYKLNTFEFCLSRVRVLNPNPNKSNKS